MKSPWVALLPKMAKKKGKKNIPYICSTHLMVSRTDVGYSYSFCLSSSPCSVAGQLRVISSPPCFRTFSKCFTHSFIHFLCVSGTELCYVKIGNKVACNDGLYICRTTVNTLCTQYSGTCLKGVAGEFNVERKWRVVAEWTSRAGIKGGWPGQMRCTKMKSTKMARHSNLAPSRHRGQYAPRLGLSKHSHERL